MSWTITLLRAFFRPRLFHVATGAPPPSPIEGGYEQRFFLPEPLQRGQSYDLAFILAPNKSEVAVYAQPCRICEESLAFHECTLQARFEAIFIGEKPQQIWQFSGLTHLQRPGQPTNQNQLDLTTSSAAQTHFTNLYGGLFAGLRMAGDRDRSDDWDICVIFVAT